MIGAGEIIGSEKFLLANSVPGQAAARGPAARTPRRRASAGQGNSLT